MRIFNSHIFKTILIFILFFSLAEHATARAKISLDELNLELSKIKCQNLGVIVWDQRLQVVDKSRREGFLGYIRSMVGIAYPQFLKGEIGLAPLMLNKIEAGYKKSGVTIDIINSSPFDSNDQLLKKIKASENEKVLVITFNKLYFDGVAKIEYVIDINVQIFNNKGDILFSSSINEKIKLGSAGKRKKRVPETLKSIFEKTLNNIELIQAIDNTSKLKSNSEELIKFDLIIKKNGVEINAIISEISETSIKYKPFNYQDGPNRTMNLTDVFMIKYKNGKKEVFNSK